MGRRFRPPEKALFHGLAMVWYFLRLVVELISSRSLPRVTYLRRRLRRGGII